MANFEYTEKDICLLMKEKIYISRVYENRKMKRRSNSTNNRFKYQQNNR